MWAYACCHPHVGGKMKVSQVLLAAGIGAALMYLFDPQQGESRRIQLRDQVTTLRDSLEGELDTRAPQVASRARDLANEARNMASRLEDDLSSSTGTRKTAES